MKILFITSTHIGDAVLTTGALDYFTKTYPDAEITVACGPLVAGLFAPAPGVCSVIALKKEPYAGHWRKLARATLGQKWDIVVDLRNSALSRLLWAKKKYIWSGKFREGHKVEQVGKVVGVSPAPSPRLWFDDATLTEADRMVAGNGPLLAIGPTANWPGKRWPQEYFIALIKKMTAPDGFLPNARVAIFAAPGEEKMAAPVLQSIPQERQVDMIGKGKPQLAAAALRHAAFYVGNDSGLTHLAAATGIPTLALFGYGFAEFYRPWGEHAAYVRTPETSAQLLAPYARTREVKSSLMTSLTVQMAYDAATALWKKCAKG